MWINQSTCLTWRTFSYIYSVELIPTKLMGLSSFLGFYVVMWRNMEMSCLLVFYYQQFNNGKRKEKTPQYSLFSVPLFCSFLVVPSITEADTTLRCCTTTFLFACERKYRGFILTSPSRHGSVCSVRDSGVGF